jgi:hypothetical protein
MARFFRLFQAFRQVIKTKLSVTISGGSVAVVKNSYGNSVDVVLAGQVEAERLKCTRNGRVVKVP